MRQLPADAADEVLRQVHGLNPELEAIALVSLEGVLLAAFEAEDANGKHIPGMSAAMVGWGERIATELGRGRLDHVMIKGQSGFVLMMSVNDEAVLTAVLNDDAKLGLLLLDLRRAASDLAKLL